MVSSKYKAEALVISFVFLILLVGLLQNVSAKLPDRISIEIIKNGEIKEKSTNDPLGTIDCSGGSKQVQYPIEGSHSVIFNTQTSDGTPISLTDSQALSTFAGLTNVDLEDTTKQYTITLTGEANYKTTWAVDKKKFKVYEGNIKYVDELIGKVGLEIPIDGHYSYDAKPECPTKSKDSAPKSGEGDLKKPKEEPPKTDTSNTDTSNICSADSDPGCSNKNFGYKGQFFDECNKACTPTNKKDKGGHTICSCGSPAASTQEPQKDLLASIFSTIRSSTNIFASAPADSYSSSEQSQGKPILGQLKDLLFSVFGVPNFFANLLSENPQSGSADKCVPACKDYEICVEGTYLKDSGTGSGWHCEAKDTTSTEKELGKGIVEDYLSKIYGKNGFSQFSKDYQMVQFYNIENKKSATLTVTTTSGKKVLVLVEKAKPNSILTFTITEPDGKVKRATVTTDAIGSGSATVNTDHPVSPDSVASLTDKSGKSVVDSTPLTPTETISTNENLNTGVSCPSAGSSEGCKLSKDGDSCTTDSGKAGICKYHQQTGSDIVRDIGYISGGCTCTPLPPKIGVCCAIDSNDCSENVIKENCEFGDWLEGGSCAQCSGLIAKAFTCPKYLTKDKVAKTTVYGGTAGAVLALQYTIQDAREDLSTGSTTAANSFVSTSLQQGATKELTSTNFPVLENSGFKMITIKVISITSNSVTLEITKTPVTGSATTESKTVASGQNLNILTVKGIPIVLKLVSATLGRTTSTSGGSSSAEPLIANNLFLNIGGPKGYSYDPAPNAWDGQSREWVLRSTDGSSLCNRFEVSLTVKYNGVVVWTGTIPKDDVHCGGGPISNQGPALLASWATGTTEFIAQIPGPSGPVTIAKSTFVNSVLQPESPSSSTPTTTTTASTATVEISAKLATSATSSTTVSNKQIIAASALDVLTAVKAHSNVVSLDQPLNSYLGLTGAGSKIFDRSKMQTAIAYFIAKQKLGESPFVAETVTNTGIFFYADSSDGAKKIDDCLASTLAAPGGETGGNIG